MDVLRKLRLLLANSTTGGMCDGLPLWQPAVYLGGDEVTYNGRKYRAKWWVGANDVPGVSDGWEDLGNCDGSTDPGGCDGLNPWEPQAYNGGAEVAHEGLKYRAKWWAGPTNVPGDGDPWELTGQCSGGGVVVSVTAIAQNTSCNGGNDGSASATANGGAGPYTYSWSNNGAVSTITGLTAGAYTVTATDADGNTGVATVTVGEPSPVTVTVTGTDENNNSSDGTATANASGGTAPYSYSWDNDTNGAAIGNLPAGTYNVIVTDANGCQANGSVTINNTIGNLTVSATQTQAVSCNGGADGEAMAFANGGTAPYSYLWSNNANGGTNTGLAAGTYSVTATDNNGATGVASVTITEPSTLNASATGNDATEGNNDGSATVNANGGTAPYSYAWSSGGNSATEANLGAGTYSVVVTDANGCTANASVTIAEIPDTGGGCACNNPEWQPQVYNGGDLVSYECNEYRAKWWAGETDVPGADVGADWNTPWELLGSCLPQGNQMPVIVFDAPFGVQTMETLTNIDLVATVTDPDGTIASVVFDIDGNSFNPSANGNTYTATWLPSAFGTFTLTITATDNEGGVKTAIATITVQQPVSGDFIITEAEYEQLFPWRYGVDIATGNMDPANDFFTYAALVEAVERMKDIEVTFERRRNTNLYRVTRKQLSTGVETVIREDANFNSSPNNGYPIIVQVVNYGSFSNEGDYDTRRREMTAFLANISQETTGGWATAPGGHYAWGLHFREEVGYENGGNLGYRDEGNVNYPPADGQSYHGRGPIQLSWNYNYGQVSEFLYGDKYVLLNNPGAILQDGALAFQTAIWFWMTPQNPKPSAHDVMVGNWTPSCFDVARGRTAGLGMTVNIINGGLECGGGTENQKVVHRIGHYQRHAGILSTSVDLDGGNTCNECGCANQQSFGGFEGEPDDCPAFVAYDPTNDNDGGPVKGGGMIAPDYLTLKTAPNPFNTQFTASFGIEQTSDVTVTLMNLQGQRVRMLYNGRMEAGKYDLEVGLGTIPPGLYILNLQTNDRVETSMVRKF